LLSCLDINGRREIPVVVGVVAGTWISRRLVVRQAEPKVWNLPAVVAIVGCGLSNVWALDGTRCERLELQLPVGLRGSARRERWR
jgi:hypothetical protein